ncbi:MAG: ABC transporter permease [Ruminococcus sp.]|nr:ABC transporter permease [Ruminococcus sp.]
MFTNDYKYTLLSTLRNKRLIGWLMIFPIVLSILFKVTFSGIYDKQVSFDPVPAAIVEDEPNEAFSSVIDSVSKGENRLLDVTYTNEEEALELLDKGDVFGVIYSSDIKLTVNGTGIEQTILKSFTDRYLVTEKLLNETAAKHPEKLPDVIASMSEEISVIEQDRLSQGNPDVYITYMYNLIAMVAVCSSVTGLSTVTETQADFSALGARKCISPTPKLINILAVLCSSWTVTAVCMMISVTFLAFVLKINFGTRLPLVYLGALMGGMTGVSMGFTIGSLVKGSYEKKNTAAMIISLFFSFMSGLMLGDMKYIVQDHIPWFNLINPAAVISDSFYFLNIDEGYERFISRLIIMVIMIIVFTLTGFIFTRRKRYASI